MSFTFAGVSTDSIEGVEATLTRWPSAGGLALDTLDVPGMAGRFFGTSRRTVTTFTFDVTIRGLNHDEALARREEFLQMIDPTEGPQSLELEGDEGWHYPRTMLAGEINWEWFASGSTDSELTLRDDVVFETLETVAARQLVQDQVSIAAGGTSYTHTLGNTSAYPRVLFTAGGSSVSDVELGIGDFDITIEGSIPAGQTVDLDWDEMEFYRLNSAGERVASLVTRMSTYTRPVLRQGRTYSLTRSGGGTAVMLPNARRS